MPYFVDTGFFVAIVNKNDRHHEDAENIYVDISNGVYSKLYTSDYILAEAVTVIRRRTKRHDLAVRVADMISRSKDIKMIHVTDTEVSGALKAYKKYDDKDLSFTDWVSISQIKAKGMHGIISFDSDFERVGIKRIYFAQA